METFGENNTHSLKSAILGKVHRQYKEHKLFFLATVFISLGLGGFLMLAEFTERKSTEYHWTAKTSQYVHVV